MDLKRRLGVSYNTVWMLKHKLMQTMRERDDSQPLRGLVEMDDADLGGLEASIHVASSNISSCPKTTQRRVLGFSA